MSAIDHEAETTWLSTLAARWHAAASWATLAATAAGILLASHVAAILLLRANGVAGDVPALLTVTISALIALGVVAGALLVRQAISSPYRR